MNLVKHFVYNLHTMKKIAYMEHALTQPHINVKKPQAFTPIVANNNNNNRISGGSIPGKFPGNRWNLISNM